MATLNGAQALDLGEFVGSLEAGKQADLCVVDLSRSRHRPLVDPLTTLVMSATPDDVVASYVAGQSVFARNDTR
jgi:5-methylthioadenosine/S-adenosylhomocysteine deaminase